jgi:hypothetical protein
MVDNESYQVDHLVMYHHFHRPVVVVAAAVVVEEVVGNLHLDHLELVVDKVIDLELHLSVVVYDRVGPFVG